jgi:hypothetical protein
MQIEFKSLQYAEFPCDALAVPVFEEEKGESPVAETLNSATRSVFRSVLASGEFKTELHSACLIHNPRGLKAKRLLLIGGGRRSELTLARLRELAGTAVRRARSAGGGRLALEDRSGLGAEAAARVVAEGALYGEYEPDAYKTRDRGGSVTIGPRFSDVYSLVFTYLHANRLRFDVDSDPLIRETVLGTDCAANPDCHEVRKLNSNVTAQLIRDTRDNQFDPTRGQRTAFAVTELPPFSGCRVDPVYPQVTVHIVEPVNALVILSHVANQPSH